MLAGVLQVDVPLYRVPVCFWAKWNGYLGQQPDQENGVYRSTRPNIYNGSDANSNEVSNSSAAFKSEWQCLQCVDGRNATWFYPRSPDCQCCFRLGRLASVRSAAVWIVHSAGLLVHRQTRLPLGKTRVLSVHQLHSSADFVPNGFDNSCAVISLIRKIVIE